MHVPEWDEAFRVTNEPVGQNDLAWRREDLKLDGLITMPQVGVWQITDAGMQDVESWARCVKEETDAKSDWEVDLNDAQDDELYITKATVEWARRIAEGHCRTTLTPPLEKLLVLQERDQKRLVLETQLKAVPRDIAAVEQKIAAEKAAIESTRGELKELEVKRKAVENEVGATEERLTKYKSQQLQVRKNDEYQALGHEIEATQAQIDALEEEELKVMYAIDEAKRKCAAAEEELKQNIAGHESRIQTLREREANLQAELQAAHESVAAARSLLDEPSLRLYDWLAAKPGQPVVVPIHECKCGGCHLKISFNIDSETRKPDKLVTCDQCGRIVYWEA